jgi:cyclopropane fatty-acyl-phospholipid synthase-like methyltransferase
MVQRPGRKYSFANGTITSKHNHSKKVMDKSNGYEKIAPIFIKGRGEAINGIGKSSVRKWARTLTTNSTVLDLGCGTGIPVSMVLIDEGMTVYGVDASPTMVKAFQQNFPNNPVACEAVEDSLFFNRKFDAIIAWGLIFLLPAALQEILIQKAANLLQTRGKFLFTATGERNEWKDAMTDQHSMSLGPAKYKELLTASGLSLIEEFEDEGENHYFNAVKI